MALVTKLYVQAKEAVSRLGQDEGGATAIEYALIAALVSVAIIGTLSTLGTEIGNTFQAVIDELPGGGGN